MKILSSALLVASQLTLAFALPQHGSHAMPEAAPMAAAKEPEPKAPTKVSPAQATSLEQLAPAVRPFKVIDSKPEVRQNAKRQLFRFGPYELPGSKVGILAFQLSHLLIEAYRERLQVGTLTNRHQGEVS